MSLKLKLALFLFLFAFLPIIVLEGFHNWGRFNTEVESARHGMREDVNKQKNVFVRFFDGLCRDMEFAAGFAEVDKLLTGHVDEDLDEIEYWNEALTSVLVSFANNRKVFADLMFAIGNQDDEHIRIMYGEDGATAVENADPPDSFSDAAKDSPSCAWTRESGKLALWLYFPVENEGMKGMVAGRVDLNQFYALCHDKEISLFTGGGIPVISAGAAADSVKKNVTPPKIKDGKAVSGMGDLGGVLFSYSRLTPVKWMENEVFTLFKTRPKSSVMTPIYNGLVSRGLSITVVMLLLMLLQIYFLNTLILKPLDGMSHIAFKLAELDLTVNVESERKDEIGKVLGDVKHMVESLRDVIARVSGAAVKVDSSAGEISQTVLEQAASATQQSVSATEISATMEEFSATSAQISDNSNAVVEIADNTLKMTREGVRAVENFMNRMNSIHENNQSNIGEITELRKKAGEIAKVMGIINNIADQTKLIAFNSALEAASAGEAGKRFGVVAAEIRRLADNVMESTGEIDLKIHDIQEAANHMVIASEISTKGIREGLESFTHTVDMLNDILTGARSTTDAAKQISLSTRQQKTATDQVVLALKDIEKGAKQTTVSITNVSAICEKLTELSAGLQALMTKFKLTDESESDMAS